MLPTAIEPQIKTLLNKASSNLAHTWLELVDFAKFLLRLYHEYVTLKVLQLTYQKEFGKL